MMKMEQRKKASIPSFQRLEDTQAVPDVHSEFPEGMTEVKDQEESWDHQVVEENMAVPRACSEFPEGMAEVKDEEESWDHQAVEENKTIPAACSGVSSELPEGMTKVKEEEELWDYQAVEENKTVPTACSEFPEGVTKVKVEEDSWDHQAVEENKTIPAACSGFPGVKVEPEEEPPVSDFHAEETGTVLDVQSGEKQLVCEATTKEHRQPKKRESGAARRKRLKLAAEEAKKSSHMELRQQKGSGVAGRKRQNLAAEEAKESSQMEHSQQKKNESEAQEQKRLKLTAEEAKKPRQLIFIFFKKPLAAPSTQSEATSQSVEMEEDEEILPEETETVDTSEPGEPEGVEECLSAMPEVILKHDVGLLPFNKVTQRPRISDALRTQMVQMGSRYFQNSEGPFKPTPPQNRRMSKRWFKVRLGDGQGKEVTRSWLMYSPAKRTAFCFCCLLFSRSEVQSALERESGFGQWKKYDRITSHENGRNHRECFTQWKEMEKNLAMSREMIDTDLQTPIEKERQKWRDILSGVLDCVKALVIQNLPYRGHRESFQLDYESNVGNFLEFVKLLAHHDPVMKQHLVNIQSHECSESYLSPGIQNEFIHLMASVVRQSILRKIRSAKYYGIMFDSTPDLAHHDLMSEVVRYVEIDAESRKVSVRESFLGFIWIRNKDAESLTGEILGQLEEDKLDLKDCRLQCYDNTAVMAGLRSGVHQRITEKNHLALFVNCDNHSLNLVGVHASSQEPKMGTFFADLDALFAFFANSDKHWAKLQEAVPLSLESQSETRWSAKAEAVKPLRMHLEDIIELLQNMEDDREETDASRREAKVLVSCLLSYDFLSYVGFWDKVLGRIDLVQRRLRNPRMNFHYAAQDLRSLQYHFDANRDILVSESIDDGISLCQKFNVEFECFRRYRKTMPLVKAREAGLTEIKEMERSMKAVLEHLHREINESFTRLHNIDTKFGFLLDIEKLCYGTDMQALQEKCVNLGNFYSSDIDGQKLYHDILDCRMLLSGQDELRISSPEQLLEFIVQFGDESAFFNLTVAIQILLTIAVSIASCERTFSKLKLILPYLRSSMDQQRLCDLALLCVEREETEKMDFDDLMDRFASAKARKVPLM